MGSNGHQPQPQVRPQDPNMPRSLATFINPPFSISSSIHEHDFFCMMAWRFYGVEPFPRKSLHGGGTSFFGFPDRLIDLFESLYLARMCIRLAWFLFALFSLALAAFGGLCTLPFLFLFWFLYRVLVYILGRMVVGWDMRTFACVYQFGLGKGNSIGHITGLKGGFGRAGRYQPGTRRGTCQARGNRNE